MFIYIKDKQKIRKNDIEINHLSILSLNYFSYFLVYFKGIFLHNIRLGLT